MYTQTPQIIPIIIATLMNQLPLIKSEIKPQMPKKIPTTALPRTYPTVMAIDVSINPIGLSLYPTLIMSI